MNDSAIPFRPPLEPMLKALGHPIRWHLLAELSAGEPLMVKELASLVGRPETTVSKHLANLRQAGLVQVGRGHLYSIPPAYLPNPGQADFGHCVLRLRDGESK